jgi:hypothetical protein
MGWSPGYLKINQVNVVPGKTKETIGLVIEGTGFEGGPGNVFAGDVFLVNVATTAVILVESLISGKEAPSEGVIRCSSVHIVQTNAIQGTATIAGARVGKYYVIMDQVVGKELQVAISPKVEYTVP